MKNKGKIYDKLQKDITSFLEERGWIVHDQLSEKYATELYSVKLETIPESPKYLIEKDGMLMWVYYFWKGAYPIWEGKIQAQITGVDWHKYDMMKGLSTITNIPCAMIFDSEKQPEIIFRQVDQLPKPKHSFAPKSDPLFQFQYFKCWREDPRRYMMLVKRARFKFKSGMAVWPKEYFGHDTNYQPKLV